MAELLQQQRAVTLANMLLDQTEPDRSLNIFIIIIIRKLTYGRLTMVPKKKRCVLWCLQEMMNLDPVSSYAHRKRNES